MKCYGLKEDQISIFHQNATVVMEETDPYASENGYYTMQGKISGKSYRIKYIRGENRIRIADIKGDKMCNCIE